MSAHIFGLESDEDLTCVICKRLMTDACQSSCGCQFCYKCIRDFIDDKDKYCPGNKKYCNDTHLSLEINVSRNAMVNKKISNLKLICPNESCLYSIEAIQNMKNEIDSLKEKLLETKKEETGELKKTVEEQGEMIVNLMEIVNDLRTNIHNKIELREESNGRENANVLFEEELRNEMEMKITEEREKINTEINEQQESMMTIVNELRMDLNQMREERKANDEDMERRLIYWLKWKQLLPNINVDYLWKIDQCSKKINAKIFSESFYSNNYKFCLFLLIDNDDNIGLSCVIMKGDNDDKVEWPLRQSVVLSIVDQKTMKAYKSGEYMYDASLGNKRTFDRPTHERNVWFIGTDSFIKYSSIKDNTSIIVADSIVVSFVITDP